MATRDQLLNDLEFYQLQLEDLMFQKANRKDLGIYDIPIYGKIFENIFTNSDQIDEKIKSTQAIINDLKQQLGYTVQNDAASAAGGFASYLPAILIVLAGILIVKRMRDKK